MQIRRVFVVLSFVLLACAAPAAAETEWREVRSKNFTLLGNAGEEEMRGVAARLEQFREVFRRVVGGMNINSPIPTRVVVFRDENSYRPYKPLKASGVVNDSIGGYFQSGEDVNYITLSLKGEPGKTYETIFHEYVHFLVENNFGDSRLPPWFNEGLAAYYETFAVEENRRVTLGAVQKDYLALIKRNKPIPFETFFGMDNYTLHEQGDDRVGIFYAQAWALMHYLMHGDGGARRKQLENFLDSLRKEKTLKQAFAEAFRTDYATLEKELAEYLAQDDYGATNIILNDELVFDREMSSLPLADAETKAYLGDLLYHADRLTEAAAHLEQSLTANPDLGLALTSLGLVKLRQGNVAEAERYLESAVARDEKNYLAHFNYAYVLSREGMTEHGFVSGYKRERAERMRSALKRAIELKPDFTESYNLLAFVNLVRNENLDETLAMVEKALEVAPGNQWYLIRAAEIRMRQEQFADARRLASSVYQTAGDDSLRLYAQNTIELINSTEAQLEQIKYEKKLPYADTISDEPFSEEEIARRREKAVLESLNETIRRPKAGEKRILGYLTNVECRAGGVTYFVKAGQEIVRLQSATFDSVFLTAYDAGASKARIGCGAPPKESFAVFNFRLKQDLETEAVGELISIEFVPGNFKLL